MALMTYFKPSQILRTVMEYHNPTVKVVEVPGTMDGSHGQKMRNKYTIRPSFSATMILHLL